MYYQKPNLKSGLPLLRSKFRSRLANFSASCFFYNSASYPETIPQDFNSNSKNESELPTSTTSPPVNRNPTPIAKKYPQNIHNVLKLNFESNLYSDLSKVSENKPLISKKLSSIQELSENTPPFLKNNETLNPTPNTTEIEKKQLSMPFPKATTPKQEKNQNGSLMPVKPIYIAPRNQIMLCHGLYGFDYRGPSKIPLLQIHYWTGIAKALKDLGSNVHIGRVSSTGGIKKRAHDLHGQLILKTTPTGEQRPKVNLIAHSMGGLDSRYLITHISPHIPRTNYQISSLTSISTPHNGSPFMDWCREYLGLGNLIDTDLGIIPEPSTSTIEEANFKIDKHIASLVRSVLDTPVHGNGNESLLNRYLFNRTYSQPTSQPENTPFQNLESGTPLIYDLRNVKENDKRLGNFAKLLKAIMGGSNILNTDISNKDNNKMHLLSNDKYLSQSNSNIKNSGVTGWGVTGGTHLGQTVVLLRQLFNRLMQLFDEPAYYCLTTSYCKDIFNPRTPAIKDVSYYSYGARINMENGCNITSSLYFPHSIVYKAEGDNDGLVSLKSARYGEYIETLECDHFELINRNRVGGFLRFLLKPILFSQPKPKGTESELDSKLNSSFVSAIGESNLEPKTNKEFDAIEFYLRVATRLYNQGH
ncbi:Lipase 2 [Smittium mucronatum]|uniref:Lipase 2 n=1 Tax=Smittium mucronatum TaxID=133383 RepID=A0A1R0GTH8_9FUNG|nr:Lipase 2 [Smittium mucronatum]